MEKKIYIGNLSYGTTEETLREQFSHFGEVESVSVIKDRFTEQSKGFGFIEMKEEADAEKAVSTMNGKTIDGRKVRVSFSDKRR